MSLTGAQLLAGLSRFINDEWSSTATSAGAADGTTLVDTALRRFGDDLIRNFYVRITQSGDNQYDIRRIEKFASSSGTITVAPAFDAQVADSSTYELHRYDPAAKFTALDEARLRVYPDLAQIVFDDTLTGDGYSSEFDIPSAIRRGPAVVFVEEPFPAEQSWNFIADPYGDSTDNWTASDLTASIYDRNDNDWVVPKHRQFATKLVVAASTNGTYQQVVGDMVNEVTAAAAAGRNMTFAMWLYTLTADKWALKITDDDATTTGSTHGGAGWELLTVSRTISPTNATTLAVTVDAASDANASIAFWEGAWFYFGDANRVQDIYPWREGKRVRRDDTTQRVMLDFVPLRGRQLRLVGRDHLSALGATAATQVTNTMEVDEAAAQVLYSEAARVLFGRETFTADEFGELATRMTIANNFRTELRTKWAQYLPGQAKLKSAWKR